MSEGKKIDVETGKFYRKNKDNIFWAIALGVPELADGKTVLTAAALTYVASVATTLIQILRLVLIYGNRRK